MGSRARHGANRLRRLTRTRLICWDTEDFLHPIHAARLTTTPTMAYVYLYEGTAVVVFFSRILLYFTLTQGLTSPGFIFPRTCFDLFMSHWFSFFLGYKINVDVVNRPYLRIFFCCFPCPIYLILAFVPSTRLHILLRMHDYPRSHTTLL